MLQYWHVAVGLGITIINNQTGEATAYTIIEKDNKGLIIQRDKATLTTELSFGADGHSVQCLNQDDQQYKYQKDPNGKKIDILLSTGIYSIKNMDLSSVSTLVAGRREYIDYTGHEIMLSETIKKQKIKCLKEKMYL